MTGWAGGPANRTWQRDRRSPDSGRIGLAEDVHRILEKWRAERGWQPGFIWDPCKATYVSPAQPEQKQHAIENENRMREKVKAK